MPELGSITHISQVISQVVAPSFMLGAVASFISLLFVRMDMALARIRDLNAIPDDDSARAGLKAGIPLLKRRIRLMHRAILLAIASGIATTLLIITAFAVALMGFEHVWGTAALFIIALGFFCASLSMLVLVMFAAVSEGDEH